MASCPCIQRAMYCLQCADIKIDIFSKIVCNACSNKNNNGSGAADDKFVSCFLCPDTGITGLENFANWPTTYHGTTVEVVGSVLEHGQLLMRGDFLHNGEQIQKRCGEDDWENAVFTNPDKAAAEIVAHVGEYDRGQTKFKIVVRLRQEPQTYTIKRGLSFRGYDLWSTNRRGTIYIEGLEVLVFKAKSTVSVPSLTIVNGSLRNDSFECPVQRQAFEILKTLKIPPSLLDARSNHCYCPKCHRDTKRLMIVGGEKCSVPLGWTMFGLAVNPVMEKLNNIQNSWHTAYHGCRPDSVASIIKSRELFIPGDVLSDGRIIKANYSIWKEADYFLSPEIKYASHVWYASPRKFRALDGSEKCFQTVLLFKVRPDTTKTKEDTEIPEVQLCTDYSVVSKDEMEWYSRRRGCNRPYGLLIGTLEANSVDQLKKLLLPTLPDDILTESVFV